MTSSSFCVFFVPQFKLVFVILFVSFRITEARNSHIPRDVQLCKRWDPELDKCVLNLLEALKPRLLRGSPEIGLPALDPITFTELEVKLGRQGRMVCHNLKATGVGNFKLNSVQTDIKNLQITVNITFPFLMYEGFYDVDGRFMNFNLKGRGPVRGNATEIKSIAKLKGRMVYKSNTKRYVEFMSADVDVDLKDYGIEIEDLFRDKQLNKEINRILNDKGSRYRKFSIRTSKPIIDKVAGKVLLEIMNRISQNFSFDEIFV